MNQETIKENLKILFKDEGMKQVILAAVDITKDDELLKSEQKKLLIIERLVNDL